MKFGDTDKVTSMFCLSVSCSEVHLVVTQRKHSATSVVSVFRPESFHLLSLPLHCGSCGPSRAGLTQQSDLTTEEDAENQHVPMAERDDLGVTKVAVRRSVTNTDV